MMPRFFKKLGTKFCQKFFENSHENLQFWNEAPQQDAYLLARIFFSELRLPAGGHKITPCKNEVPISFLPLFFSFIFFFAFVFGFGGAIL